MNKYNMLKSWTLIFLIFTFIIGTIPVFADYKSEYETAFHRDRKNATYSGNEPTIRVNGELLGSYRLSQDSQGNYYSTLIEPLKAVIKDGTTLVPLRDIAEELEYEVIWAAESKTINLKGISTILGLQIGNDKISKLNRETNVTTVLSSSVAPQIIAGETFVPVRTIAEAFGADVQWDAGTKIVNITTTSSGMCGDNVSWQLNGNVLTINGTGPMYNTVGNTANWASLKLTTEPIDVIIGEGVTTIGDNVFKDCNIKSISIPSTVTSIGAGAFRDSFGLKSITIPDTVTKIGYAAFFSCADLTYVKISDSVSKIEENTFWFCSSLQTVMIPPSVVDIESGAFTGCKNLTIHCKRGSVADDLTKYDLFGDYNIKLLYDYL